jgi:hypothetical protein
MHSPGTDKAELPEAQSAIYKYLSASHYALVYVPSTTGHIHPAGANPALHLHEFNPTGVEILSSVHSVANS